ncbi:DUF11 domain-containing protein, partial [Cellulophaga sp. E16_2]|uniref:DUF11 domain-containing protein n=1 Tax=Cellulophaga sp. E16_2 TaxID=2789297 RepID=UPI001A92741C
LASGYTFDSAIASVGTYQPLNGSWTVGSLASGVTQTLTIIVDVLSTGIYTNTAELTDVTEFDVDSEPANNDATEDDQATVNPVPVSVSDVALTKSVNNATPLVGENVEFTIDLSNAGPNDASGVVVTDQLPSGYTYVSHTATAGSYVESTGVWNINGLLFESTTETLTIVATVNQTGDYNNVAEVTASDNNDPNSTPNNNILAEDDQDDATVTPIQIADISLEKSVSTTTPDVTTDITFTIEVTNDGPSDVTNLVVTDQLPTGYTYVSDDGATTYDAGTGLWTIGALANGASTSINIVANVNTTGDYTNVAEVTAVDQTDSDSTPNNAILAEDDQDEVVVTPRSIVDISVTKVASTLTPNVGSQIDFIVEVTNDGPSDATTVVVTDVLASGYTFDSAIASVGTYQPLNGSWTVGNLAS